MTYQQALNAWADSLLPSLLTRAGDAELVTSYDPGFQYSEYTLQDPSASAELVVPCESYDANVLHQIDRPLLLHRWFKTDWVHPIEFMEDEFDIGELIRTLIQFNINGIIETLQPSNNENQGVSGAQPDRHVEDSLIATGRLDDQIRIIPGRTFSDAIYERRDRAAAGWIGIASDPPYGGADPSRPF